MHGNVDFLNRLKKDAAKRNRRTESIAWMVGAVVAGALALYATKDTFTRLCLLGALGVTVGLVYFYGFVLQDNTSNRETSGRSNDRVEPSHRVEQAERTATSRQASVNASVVSEATSPFKSKHQQSKQYEQTYDENFDAQSPQRIAQAFCSDGPTEQPTFHTTAPSLYNTTSNTYVGKANMANLGFQFTGRVSSLRSPVRPSTTPNGSGMSGSQRTGAFPTTQTGLKAEPTTPTWYDYQNSPPNVDIGTGSPSGSYRRGGQSSQQEDEDIYDPLRDIVARVAAEQRGEEPALDSGIFSPAASARSGSASGPRSAAKTPRFGRQGAAGSGLGLTEDRLEHVLGKYLQAQEEIVNESALAIVGQLTLRANSAVGGSGSGGALLQTQEDVTRVQALLLLQSDRQVLSNRKAVTLPELLRHCRAVGIPEELLARYEAAAAVLLSPNRPSSTFSPSPAPSSGVGGLQGVTSPPLLRRSSSGSGTFSAGVAGTTSTLGGSMGGSTFAGSSSSYGFSSPNPKATAASFGKGWATPLPAVSPFPSSSHYAGTGVGSSTFADGRRGRRY